MAFQQQQARPQQQRQHSTPQQEQQHHHHHQSTQRQSPTRKRTLEESEEWILFSPQADTASRTATSQARTATQYSDFGSLETHIRSQVGVEAAQEQSGGEYNDENEELDSLDDGLHAFQHNPFSSSSLDLLDQSGGSVLPTHDGLGTFSAPGMQNQMWQFERHNPHRRRGMTRKSSLQQRINEVEEELELGGEDERMTRVEQWRLDQSKAILEELERETTRRRRRMSRMSGTGRSQPFASMLEHSTDDFGLTPTQSTTGTAQPIADGHNESWWARITRRVIREIIGIDDTTLSVLFGETMPDGSPTPTQASPLATAAKQESRVTFNDSSYGWELRLIERIARELGILVNTLTHDRDTAFSTYDSTTNDSTTTLSIPVRDLAPRQPSLRSRRHLAAQQSSSSSDIAFTPTLATQPHTPNTEADMSLWGIEEEPEESASAADQRVEQEHWHRDIDLPTILAYVRRHFSRPTPDPQPSSIEDSGPLPASWATGNGNATASALGTSPESRARAESIRRQHPLVHRAAERAAAQHRRRESLLRKHQMAALMQRARGSSCASHSTKRSRRTRSGSGSRHFWDIGGKSVSSDAAFSSGPAGNWGEV